MRAHPTAAITGARSAGIAAARAGPAGKRERTKAANREAILAAARAVFSDVGYGAASVRDIVRRTDLASGTFYNYFPDKESVLRALVDEIAVEARARVRAARAAATTLEAFVADGYRAYFGFLARDPSTVALMRRNAGTIRALFDEPALGAGIDELRADLEAGVAAGALPPHDTELMAAAMVGSAVEVGIAMVAADPIDVERAVSLVTTVYVGAFEHIQR
ncbi:MAG TPA: TetR/AcrR family transcriptional regulator [Solirubrobacteraceae bacterium]|nr:TetR/AcrR family transcriptional regulator [Solirubrobacteraceae bacterium]